ncbi:hypothetical protein ACQZ6C_07530 [Rhizobium rhizogenes]|uniref:hypothetical protein n=1 Tax=Rhizobium TaxID=379 RepID=UPI00026EE2B7|nr:MULTISPECIES: hypothetical protein [Rhizobium]EJK79609.1 hypothetical protein PMI03_05260 [Rhizobium sp. AP16]NTF88465.1 hypothetical protein [Rhizobium rhizogenes]NTG45946.1 hypothetical protein [Rhizobium rhizogenes]
MKKFILSFLFVGTMLSPAAAQSTITRDGSARLLDSYRAYIGHDDLYNSKGERLELPWQIIRQDRANYHAYRRRDRGDQGDSFFSDPANRQRLEVMLASGTITDDAANDIVRGNIWIKVDIYGRGDIGEWVDVHVQE